MGRGEPLRFMTIEKRYDFKEVESRIYKKWRESRCFSSAIDSNGNVVHEHLKKAKPYVLMIPSSKRHRTSAYGACS